MPYLLYFLFTDWGANFMMRWTAIGLLLCFGGWLLWRLYRSLKKSKSQ